MFYIWTTPANLKIQLKPSMSEIRNYLVANSIIRNGEKNMEKNQFLKFILKSLKKLIKFKEYIYNYSKY